MKHHWVLPKADDPDFICAMEDVLEVYTRPYDAECPQVCVDEVSKQLVKDITPPVPMQPGQPAREDYEYERCGTANLFMICEPLAGRRHVKVTDRRTSADFALVLRDLSDVHYPEAKKIVLVMDNLNTHKLSVLYQVFPPAEARRILERFEVHYTPQARQLAQHGRVRVISAQPPMPRSTDRLFRPSHGRSRRLGTPA